MILRTIIKWGWAPVVIAAVAITAVLLEWPMEIFIPVVAILLVVSLIVMIIAARGRESGRMATRLRYLSAYFNRRFLGESSLSIFAIIDSLFKLENTKVWDWARACDMAQRVFNGWSDGFNERMNMDTRTGQYSVFITLYLNELWSMNNFYYEFVEQFYEIGQHMELPPEVVAQYNRFTSE